MEELGFLAPWLFKLIWLIVWLVNGVFDVLISLVWLILSKIRFGLETLVLREVSLVELRLR